MFNKIIALLMLVVLSACSSVDISDEKPVLPKQMLEDEYRIGVSDVLQVNVWQNAELSVAVPVRPDGKISVPLVGDVVAAGLTAEKLAAEMEKSLANYIRNPEVTVIVTNPVSAGYLQRVRITGAVTTAQSLAYQQGMTVLDLVLEAGGLTAFADGNDALLYRQTETGVKIYPVYVDDIVDEGKLETNYEMAPYGILTIPERAF